MHKCVCVCVICCVLHKQTLSSFWSFVFLLVPRMNPDLTGQLIRSVKRRRSPVVKEMMSAQARLPHESLFLDVLVSGWLRLSLDGLLFSSANDFAKTCSTCVCFQVRVTQLSFGERVCCIDCASCLIAKLSTL